MRKISISARQLLIETKSKVAEGTSLVETTEYALNTDMVEFIRSIKNKYRVYLLTRLAADPNAAEGSSEQEHE